MKRMKVCVVTGTRAEFGIWRSVLEGIFASKKLELQLVVTGMHLQREFGGTVKDVEGSGFEIAARVPMYKVGEAASESLGRGVGGLGKVFRKLKPDVVMVLGDRLEMLAAGCAAVAERILIGHVHGGETAPGQWDEQIRHALTKMAQVHFCATEVAGRRILRMGEDPKRVHVVGAPALDGIQRFLQTHRSGIVAGGSALFLLHPSSGEEDLEYKRTGMAMNALRKFFGRDEIQVIGPNNDPGHAGILRAIRVFRSTRGIGRPGFAMSMAQDEFWQALRASALLIGNSSSGILEAASFGLPVVNIGERQAGRERSGNVIDVGWESGVAGIARAIGRVAQDKKFLREVGKRKNVYGDGKAGGRIVGVLEGMARAGVSVGKRFAD